MVYYLLCVVGVWYIGIGIVVTWKVKRGKSIELFCGTWYCRVGIYIDLNLYLATDYSCFRLPLEHGKFS